MEDYYIATHKLKKTFKYDEKSFFRKGAPVYIPKGHKFWNGNVFFLTPTGRIKSNRDQLVHLYSKSFFKPRKEWFEKIL